MSHIPSMGAQTTRLVAVLGIGSLVVVVLAVRGWSNARPVGATGNVVVAVDSTGDLGNDSSLVLDSDERPVISYVDFTNNALKVVHCGDADCISGNTITSPDTAERVGSWSSIALDSLGNPVISYINDLYPELRVLRCGDATCTAGNSIHVAGVVYGFQNQTSLVLDGSGNPIISYYSSYYSQYSPGGLWVLHCGNEDCTSGNSVTTPDLGGNIGKSNSLALDASGNPVISYWDSQLYDLRLLHCGSPDCTSGNVIAIPDSSGTVGGSTSLKLDPTGNPVISYSEYNHQDLKLLHCGNATCSSGNTIISPDTAGSVGSYTSLELDAAGNPVVSYYDYTNGDLKVLHCGNAMCTVGNTIASPDTGGDVGLSTSLELDSSGNPVVSYYDLSNRDLKVLHCGDPTCKGRVIPTSTQTSTITATRTPGTSQTSTPPGTPTPSLTNTPTSSPTSSSPPLGGVAGYPNVSSGQSATLLALIAAATAFAALGVGVATRRLIAYRRALSS